MSPSESPQSVDLNPAIRIESQGKLRSMVNSLHGNDHEADILIKRAKFVREEFDEVDGALKVEFPFKVNSEIGEEIPFTVRLIFYYFRRTESGGYQLDTESILAGKTIFKYSLREAKDIGVTDNGYITILQELGQQGLRISNEGVVTVIPFV